MFKYLLFSILISSATVTTAHADCTSIAAAFERQLISERVEFARRENIPIQITIDKSSVLPMPVGVAAANEAVQMFLLLQVRNLAAAKGVHFEHELLVGKVGVQSEPVGSPANWKMSQENRLVLTGSRSMRLFVANLIREKRLLFADALALP